MPFDDAEPIRRDGPGDPNARDERCPQPDPDADFDAAIGFIRQSSARGIISADDAEAAVRRIERQKQARREHGPFGAAVREWTEGANIPVFPVEITECGRKKPMVTSCGRVGPQGAAELARRYPGAPGAGFCADRADVTVVDVDSPDEAALADALRRHGDTPAVARTASGGWHLFYRGQRAPRMIRPWGRDLPVDVIGKGLVVAAPTRTPAGIYFWLRGGPEVLRDLPDPRLDLPARDPWVDARGVPVGERNMTLWRLAMAEAPFCDTVLDLEDVVATRNAEGCEDPLEQWEVCKIAESAWSYETRGENWIGRGGRGRAAADPVSDLDLGRRSADALILLLELRAQWIPGATFAVANAMARTIRPRPWGDKRFAAARAVLIETGHLVELKPATRHKPALYRFGREPSSN